jgi:hypothetical protein
VRNLNITKRENWKEALITTDTHYLIWKELTDEIFLSLTVTAEEGNLWMKRLQMQQLRKKSDR